MTLRDDLDSLIELRERKYRNHRGKAYHFRVTNGLSAEVEQLLEQLMEDEAVIREVQWMLLEADERIDLSFAQVATVLENLMRVLKSEVTEQEEEADGNN